MRILAVVPVLVASVLLAFVLPGSASAAPRADVAGALEVLHAWDARRAQAWADSDPAALRSLYVHGSRAGRADVRLLRDYTRRGFVVRRLVTQVFAARVLHRGPTLVRLRVFDRVAGGEIVRDGRRARLASTPPVHRTVELRRVNGAWVVSRVTG